VIVFFVFVGVINAASGGKTHSSTPSAKKSVASANVETTEMAAETTTTPPATTTPPTAPPTTAPPVTSPPPPVESISQSNAVSKAQDYLDYEAFSRSGLIDQLVFEGFSTEDATYAVDKWSSSFHGISNAAR